MDAWGAYGRHFEPKVGDSGSLWAHSFFIFARLRSEVDFRSIISGTLGRSAAEGGPLDLKLRALCLARPATSDEVRRILRATPSAAGPCSTMQDRGYRIIVARLRA